MVLGTGTGTGNRSDLSCKVISSLCKEYDRQLILNGHHTDINKLISSIESYGGVDIVYKQSSWSINHKDISHQYMWRAMYHFIVTTALFPLLANYNENIENLCITLKSILSSKNAEFRVTNHDFLFKLSAASFNDMIPNKTTVQELFLEFTGIRKIRISSQALPEIDYDKVLLKSICSLVSTGTELKVFKGELEADQAADLTIEALADK